MAKKAFHFVTRTNTSIHEYEKAFMSYLDYFDIKIIGIVIPNNFITSCFEKEMSPERCFFHLMLSHNKDLFIKMIKEKKKFLFKIIFVDIVFMVICFLNLSMISINDFSMIRNIILFLISLISIEQIYQSFHPLCSCRLVFYGSGKGILNFVRDSNSIRRSRY